MPEDPPAPPAPSGSRLALLSVVVVLVGLCGVAIAFALGRVDTALLYVGIPCLLAFAVGAVRGRGGWGQVFQVVTVVLLLSAALLQEGAICVLLVSPLVYGAAALAYAATTSLSRRQGSFVLAPVVAVVLVEGVLPGTRIHPQQQASAERVVAQRCTEFEAALERGPRFEESDLPALLRVLRYPAPSAAAGAGLEPGDRWTLTLGQGVVRTHVTDRAPGVLRFGLDEDTTKLKRWATVSGGTLRWADGPDGCRATMTVDYERRLDPALWFGPVTGAFMDAGATAFLASLD